MVSETQNQPQTRSAAKWLAVWGALITGAAGIAMAVYSVVMGEETGGGALLAASALAFGLLAANVDRVPRPGTNGVAAAAPQKVEAPAVEARVAVGTGVHSAAAEQAQPQEQRPVAQFAFHAGTQEQSGGMNVSHINGMLVIRPRDASGVADHDIEPITDREREVLALVADGLSNKEISEKLFISERKVKNHLTSTMAKLRASDRTRAVVKAIRMGWLQI